jgi:hypothetical protein
MCDGGRKFAVQSQPDESFDELVDGEERWQTGEK